MMLEIRVENDWNTFKEVQIAYETILSNHRHNSNKRNIPR